MLFHSFQYGGGVIRRVVKQHIEPRFRAFAGFFKVCNKFVQILAFAPRFNKRDKQLYNALRAFDKLELEPLKKLM